MTARHGTRPGTPGRRPRRDEDRARLIYRDPEFLRRSLTEREPRR